MASHKSQERFLLYPDPVRAQRPSVPYRNEEKKNPRLPGWLLVVVAFLQVPQSHFPAQSSWLGFFRRHIWRNAGFASLRRIREHLHKTEPRLDPTVIPFRTLAQPLVSESEEEAEEGGSEGQHNSPDLSSPKDIVRYSVSHYRELYLSGQITPLDVARTLLSLIRPDTSPPGVHSTAWIEVKAELIMDAAKSSTLRYKEGRSLGALDGIPVGIKDEYDVEGYETTLGSVKKDVVEGSGAADIDSWCVQMLKEAGAMIMGKTTMVEYGMDTSGNNPSFGTPRNPYNENYYTGGSSSGSAYAVSSGLVPIAMGSDAGGSIRIPSSFCSIVGLKPTHGRLSYMPSTNYCSSCAVKGPIAADVSSLAAVYEVVSQPHPTSPFYGSHIPRSPWKSLTGNTETPKIIGVPEAWIQHASPGIQKLYQASITRLAESEGYKVVSIEIPFVEEGRIAHAMTTLTEASAMLADTRGISPAIRIMMALGRTTPANDLLLSQKLRRVLMQHLAWLWQEHPGMVIVTPTTACAGWPIRSASELKYGINDGNRTQESMEYVWMANFCGVPSITLPIGYVVPEGQNGEGECASEDTSGKIPVGLMAMGEWATERALMKFGLDVEEVCGEIQSRPPGWVDVLELAKQQTEVTGKGSDE
ncbi:hypothetical protein HYFRA_00014116 [Hymenoscyphus fraxineus]|uniref:Amidase domain-containing protein n=1 Tax=Hymenoscyphus fraxineus TaxID=746836 RepID=A0A9N9LCK6_9HELO|nr:hypothetical protein HYFRA_00014116 [Hymenoscyphus fraxineus]